MNPHLEAEILAASQPLRLPGGMEERVLTPAAVERLATGCEWPRWKVEALALELGIAPLHFLRNLACFGHDGQARLLRTTAALAGRGPVFFRAAELLALNGFGRLLLLAPAGANAEADRAAGERAAAHARNRYVGCETEVRLLSLKSGNPAETVRGADVAAACLTQAAEEQLLQFACRIHRVPLVLAGLEGRRGQCFTVYPGDRGAAGVYRPTHPHLEPSRAAGDEDPHAVLMVGGWIANTVTQLALGETPLRDQLLYADLDTGQKAVFDL